ncbi:outer membrane receptor for ferrienterochelin and colicin [Novosphingobium kunmingense]|uniref:Outer membrane receptor for ferrienterochelin and colicin n=1 Tax=Novosphingobium kunmingense TaxID=1211806 RepID=A0A2N0H6B4_9SPHN|nr:TonB-dependent receptor [Novosphingobium kunmingense]PKB14491.1 outer membrane receptor for ferrienterochelin and colicin [Novosphingobium kunmingense]
MTSSRLALTVALAMALPGLARAATDAEQPAIVVTGQGLPDSPATPAYDVVTLGADQLAASASGRLEDALGAVAGFQQFRRSDSRSSNPSAQGATLRALGGNATSRTLILLDAVPLADPFFGYIPFASVAPERLAMARITRGGGSGAFGAGAVAGTIELTSAAPPQLGLFDGSALVNDRGETELSASLAPQLGGGFAELAGRWDRGHGFWTTPEAQRVPASVRARFDSWSASARAVAPLGSDTELQARVAAFNDERTLRFAGADTSSSGQTASLRLVGKGDWGFDALAYVQAGNFTNVVISSTTFRTSLDQYATPTTGTGGKLELRPPLGGDHVLRLGGDWRIASGEAKEVAYNASTGAVTARRIAGGRNSLFGFYLEDDWTLGPVVLTAGARADRWAISDGHFISRTAAGAVTLSSAFADRSGWETTFRGGALADLGAGVKLRAAGYTGFRLPTLNELYRPFAVFPVTTSANADLENERLRGVSAGLDWTPVEAVTLSFTAFDDKVRRAISNVTTGVNARQRRNVDAVHSRGLELGFQAAAGQVRFDGSLALTDAEVEASGTAIGLDGKRPAQTPRVAASGTLSWKPAEDWTLALTLRHVGQQFEDDLETDSLPAATILGAFAEIPLRQGLSLVLRGENLTGEQVLTRKQGTSVDLGVPRTVWAGVRVSLR